MASLDSSARRPERYTDSQSTSHGDLDRARGGRSSPGSVVQTSLEIVTPGTNVTADGNPVSTCTGALDRISPSDRLSGGSGSSRVVERTTRFLLLLPFVLALILGIGCEADSPSSQPPVSGRVLLIGIDGASDRVLGPMMRAGRLPNLSRIAKDGVYGPILSSYPLLSPRIWTTVATGKHSDKHGIGG